MSQLQKADDHTKAVIHLIESQKSQIARALPKHLSADRMARIVLTEIRRTPKLLQCDKMSLLGAVIQCAQLGLEPGSGLGHAYLIPYGKECKLIPGFKGLIDLARRSGHIETISARVVREKDQFDFAYGDDERIIHVPFRGKAEDAGPITYVYAIAKMVGGGIQREVMSREQIEWVRDRGNKNDVWETDFDEMARKTAVRRICKYLPLSPQMAVALEKDNEAYDGKSQRNWEVIDIDYTPEPEKVDVEKGNALRNDSSPPPPMEHEQRAMDAERKAAIEKFQNALQAMKGRGATDADVEALMKLHPSEIVKFPAVRLAAAAKLCDGWRKA
jgi:recombination protein RecT